MLPLVWLVSDSAASPDSCNIPPGVLTTPRSQGAVQIRDELSSTLVNY